MREFSERSSSCASSSSSIRSNKSKKQASYSHLLYVSDSDRQFYMNSAENMTSRFSSSSTSPASSAASLPQSQPISEPSTKPSSIHSISGSTKEVPLPPRSPLTIPQSKYADTHYPLIISTSPPPAHTLTEPDHSALGAARTMALIHNTIIRAINSAYNHALTVSPQGNLQRTRDYLTFCQTLYSFLEHHHHTEEEHFFPAIEAMIEQPGAMDVNVKGHELFMPGLDAWGAYINNPATATSYCGAENRRLIEAFAPDLIEHLHDEIRTLSHLAANPKCTSKGMDKIMAEAHKVANKDVDLYTNGPWMLGCQDREFRIDGVREEQAWPPVPWLIGQVVKKWHARKWKGAWDFCPSDFEGQRRMIDA